ncbi:hypothetical protein [Planomonospora algeriensis]
MSAEGVEHALRIRGEERDRISGDVLDLDAHTVFRLLGGSALHGETARRWADAERRAALLWALLDAYRDVLDRAERIAGSRRRLGASELAELTGLLTGPAVRLAPEARPVERRSLLASPGERFTLDGAVAAMDAAFRDVTALIADVDAVWSAALPGLDAAASAAAAARRLLRGLGAGDPELDACEREIERLGGNCAVIRSVPAAGGRRPWNAPPPPPGACASGRSAPRRSAGSTARTARRWSCSSPGRPRPRRRPAGPATSCW